MFVEVTEETLVGGAFLHPPPRPTPPPSWIWWTGELYRAQRIANDFDFEVKRITKKFLSAGFPKNFIRNTTEYFNKDKDDYIIAVSYLMSES